MSFRPFSPLLVTLISMLSTPRIHARPDARDQPFAQDDPPIPKRSVAALLLPLRLFLAAGWLRAGVEKVIEPDWWTGDLLAEFLNEQRSEMLPFFRSFADAFVSPFTGPVAWLVVEAQIAIGLCLLLGRYTKQALWAGVVLNLTFVMSGRVNPSAFYLVMEMVLLFALSRPVPVKTAARRAALWSIPAVAVLPFARTIAPAEVIDDPALMLSFVSGLAAITTLALVNGDASAGTAGKSIRRVLQQD
jgi:thiosulfate dehydrogenase [quinone] large subunit